jgi:chromosome segregation ATPase
MQKARQPLSFALMIASVIFLLVSMAAIALTWVYHQQVQVELLPRLETIESDLRSAQGDLQFAKTELDQVQLQIDALQIALDTLGIDGAASLKAIADLVGKLEGTLTPIISAVAERVQDLRDALTRLKETIDKLNQLPLVNLEIPGVEQLEEAASSLGSLQETIEGGGDKVSQASNITQETVTALTTGFAELEASAQNLSAALAGYDAKISAYLVEIDVLQASLPRWANVMALSLTVLLVWLGISQVALFTLSWSLYAGKNPFPWS